MSSGNEEGTDNGNSQSDRTDQIARRAYERWQERGCPQGDGLSDWLEAEQEIAAAALPSSPPAKANATSGSRTRETP